MPNSNKAQGIRGAALEGVEALEKLWAAIGDALCSGKGIDQSYAHSVQCDITNARNNLRAALAEPQPGLEELANDVVHQIFGSGDSGKNSRQVILAALQAAFDAAKEEQREADANAVVRLIDLTRDEIAQVIRGGK